MMVCFFFFKQKTAYEMRISDWSSDVCSSDLVPDLSAAIVAAAAPAARRRSRLASEPISAARWGLLVLGLTQLVLAVPSLVGLSDGSVHATREVGAFKIGRASCRERVCQYV